MSMHTYKDRWNFVSTAHQFGTRPREKPGEDKQKGVEKAEAGRKVRRFENDFLGRTTAGKRRGIDRSAMPVQGFGVMHLSLRDCKLKTWNRKTELSKINRGTT